MQHENCSISYLGLNIQVNMNYQRSESVNIQYIHMYIYIIQGYTCILTIQSTGTSKIYISEIYNYMISFSFL